LQVKGCHQSLYSLWTVPDFVFFENKERANLPPRFGRSVQRSRAQNGGNEGHTNYRSDTTHEPRVCRQSVTPLTALNWSNDKKWSDIRSHRRRRPAGRPKSVSGRRSARCSSKKPRNDP
jgi:hypothetical protein